jgi:glutamate-ammonia-ligase adenylyltransferase
LVLDGKDQQGFCTKTLRQDVARQCPDVDPQVIDYLFAQLDVDYFRVFSVAQIATHVRLLDTVDHEHPVRVHWQSLPEARLELLIVAFDYFGEFSIMTGLLAAHGLNIRAGQVFSYRSGPGRTTPWGHTDGGLIVDVFRLEETAAQPFDQAAQEAFADQLTTLIQLIRQGQLQQARDSLNYRLIEAMRASRTAFTTNPSPVEIDIDNERSADWTVVDIATDDTPGFLYSLSNALAMRNMYIHRVEIDSRAGKVQDRLYLGWRRGGKIVAPEGLRELRLIVALIKQFTHFLTHAPDPVKALRHFDQLMDRLANDGSFHDTFPWLWEAGTLEALATVLGSSDFLWQDFLRQQYAVLLPVLLETTASSQRLEQAELTRLLHQAMRSAQTAAERKDRLNAFKDREMFRIDMRHLLHPELPFGLFSEELTDLAEVVMAEAMSLAQHALQAQHGLPVLTDGSPCAFALFGLGKFGGRELGYASDIEMLCVYSGQGTSSGPERISLSEYADKLVRQLLDLIVARRSGIFELDLRLRPFGTKGPLATSVDAFETYYRAKGRAAPFERQALIKLRWVAGDADLGCHIETLRDDFVYSPMPLELETSVKLRQQQVDELVKSGSTDSKYGRGGLVDIEYTVQYLQIMHGAATPSVRTPNTLEGLNALHAAGYVSRLEYEQLYASYIFLRHLIDALRIVRGHARDLVLPAPESEESTFLARRMGYWEAAEPAVLLFQDIASHMQRVAQIYDERFTQA